jgi:hypothetical protein
MRDIYENAKKLAIWLGVEADGSHDAIEIMKEFPGGFDKDTIAEWLKWFQMQPNSVDLWSSIICFFSRSWYTRVWVIQEFVVSMESHDMRIENQEDFIEFYCGRSRVIPNVLVNVLAAARVIDKSKPRSRSSTDSLIVLLGKGA